MPFLESLGVLAILISDLITIISLVLDQTDVFLLGIALPIKGINAFTHLVVYMCQTMSSLMNSLFHMCRSDFSSIAQSCSSSYISSESRVTLVPNPQVQSPLQVPPASASLPADIPQVFSPSSPSFSSSSSTLHTYSTHTTQSPPHILPAAPPIGHPMITRSKVGIFKLKSYLTALLAIASEPTSVSVALSNPKWFKAMQEEYQALQNNHTWDLVLPSEPVKVVGNKWIFKIKYHADGTISRYKAMLVAKGFHQTQGVDYIETFSPVVKASTVRVILSLAIMNRWQLRQVDVNNVFLNGILVEDVYMGQLEGFIDLA